MAARKLTSRFCDSVQPTPGKQVAYPDALVPGLEFRVSGEGRKAWSLRYRTREGRQCRLSLGVYPAVDLADARTGALKALGQIAAGKDPAADRRIEKARGRTREIETFGDLVTEYFRACEAGEWRPKGKTKRARTIVDERGTYRRHLEKPLGKVRLGEVTRALCKKTLRDMVARGLGVQVNRAQALIRQVFNYAIAEEIADDLIVANPATGFAPLVAEKARTRVLSDEELKKLWAALKDPSGLTIPVQAAFDKSKPVHVGRSMRIALQLCTLLLQRKGEVVGMRVSELDLDEGRWTIPAERMKGGRAHTVPLPDKAVALIKEALALNADTETDCVFPGYRDATKPMRPDSVTHAMAQLTAALSIAGASPHDLRRTGSTALTSERIGVSPFIRSQVLGHASDAGGGAAVSIAHYDANTYLPDKRRALRGWEALLLQVVGEKERSRPT